MSERRLVPGLETPHPLGVAMPVLFHDDDFVQRFLDALDDVLAPVFCTLDNLDAYLDPELAPDDFVAWLAGWVGIALDENWDDERQRDLVRRAADLYAWRGTAGGLAAHVGVYTGVTPEIVDTGGCTWSPTPGSDPPGEASPRVTVRLRVDDPSTIDVPRLDALVAAAKPAHVSHDVEVVPT